MWKKPTIYQEVRALYVYKTAKWELSFLIFCDRISDKHPQDSTVRIHFMTFQEALWNFQTFSCPQMNRE